MRIDIQARGFELTPGLREHTERRLQFALSWAVNDVRNVNVRLSDINGPRGGSDKRCHILIPLAGGHDVVIEDTEADLYVAIDRAADRSERALARRLQRLREHVHARPAVGEEALAGSDTLAGPEPDGDAEAAATNAGPASTHAGAAQNN